MIRITLLQSILLLTLMICFCAPLYAQEVDVEEAAPPEQVIKLEELIIEIEPLKVFIIPRMEAELPPIDFAGIFMYEYMEPDPLFYEIDIYDLEPMLAIPRKTILEKERK